MSDIEIVAELSANHNGKLETALEIVRAAKAAGADAIKLQTYHPERMAMANIIIEADSPWKGKDYVELYRKGHLPEAWHRKLVVEADRLDLPWFSTPFHPKDVDFLEAIGCPRYKVSSFSIDDLPLLRRIDKTGKPVVMSTGSASDDEIQAAIEVIGNPLTLLHCISSYPADPAKMNIARMGWMLDKWGFAVGLSDHSLTHTAAILAVGQGATMIEKHLRAYNGLGGIDSDFSLNPEEFEDMIIEVRAAEQAMILRDIDEEPREFRTSLWCAQTLRPGSKICEKHIAVCRPGRGLSPMEIDQVIGAEATDNFVVGTPLTTRSFG